MTTSARSRAGVGNGFAAVICPRCRAGNSLAWFSDHYGDYRMCRLCSHTMYPKDALYFSEGQTLRYRDGEAFIDELERSGRTIESVSEVSERLEIPEVELKRLVAYGYADGVWFDDRALMLDVSGETEARLLDLLKAPEKLRGLEVSLA